MLIIIFLFFILFFSIFFRGKSEAGFSFIYISIAFSIIIVLIRSFRQLIKPTKLNLLLFLPIICYLFFCLMLLAQETFQSNINQYILDYWLNISSIFLILTAIQILLIESDDFSYDFALVIYLGGLVSIIKLIVDLLAGNYNEFYRANLWASRNTASIGLALSFLSGIHLLICGKYKNNMFIKSILFAGLILVMSGLILSGSRTALIGAIVGAIIILWITKSQKILRLTLAISCVSAICGLVFIYLNTTDLTLLVERFGASILKDGVFSRTSLWIESLKHAQISGFIGDASYYYFDNTLFLEPHNLLISILLFLGYASAIIFLTINAYVFGKFIYIINYLLPKDRPVYSYSFAVYTCLFIYWLAGGDPAKGVLPYLGLILIIVFLYIRKRV